MISLYSYIGICQYLILEYLFYFVKRRINKFSSLENGISDSPLLAAWMTEILSTRRYLHLLYDTKCHVNNFPGVGRLCTIQLDMLCTQMVKQADSSTHQHWNNMNREFVKQPSLKSLSSNIRTIQSYSLIASRSLGLLDSTLHAIADERSIELTNIFRRLMCH